MSHPYVPELKWLIYVTIFTALMWVPYILNRLVTRGLWPSLSNAAAETGETPTIWARRALRAHANAVENLIIFVPAVLVVSILGISTPTTQYAAMVYFYARIVHYFVYILGIPVVRTLAFAVAWAAQITILLSILKSMS